MSKGQKLAILLPIFYFAAVTGILIWHGTWFSPDQFFAAAFLAALFLGRSRQFIRDWSLPVVLLLSYDYLRGLAPKLTQAVNIYPMINFDKAVFKDLPTIALQNMFYSAGKVSWYDYLGTVLYMSHFTIPLVFGYIFWIKDKIVFKNYFLALLLLSYAAFITYILFPAMPPWMASQKGIIPEVFKVMDQVFLNFAGRIDLPSFYKLVGVNLVAAVPSLHAAYPLLTMFFLIKRFRRFGLLLLPYVLAVWFSIVYMGEHYVFDIVAGLIYAVLAFYIVINANLIWYKISLIGSKKVFKRVNYPK